MASTHLLLAIDASLSSDTHNSGTLTQCMWGEAAHDYCMHYLTLQADRNAQAKPVSSLQTPATNVVKWKPSNTCSSSVVVSRHCKRNSSSCYCTHGLPAKSAPMVKWSFSHAGNGAQNIVCTPQTVQPHHLAALHDPPESVCGE